MTDEKDKLMKEKEKLRSRLDKAKTQTDHVLLFLFFVIGTPV